MKFDHEVVLGEDKGKMFSTLIALNWPVNVFNRCRGCETNLGPKIPRTTGAILNSIAPRLVGA